MIGSGMADHSREHRSEQEHKLEQKSFLFCQEKPTSAMEKNIAELAWVDRIVLSALETQETHTLLLQQGRVVVLAVAKGRLQIESDVLMGTLQRGQAVMLSGGGKCSLMALQQGECVAAVLSGTLVTQVLQMQLAQARVFCQTGLSDLLETANALGKPPQSVEQISAAAYYLLMRLHETARLYEKSSGYPLLVNAGIGIIREEFAHIAGVDEVAERLGISTAHFARLFSRAVGTPPGRFLKLQKLEYAKKLLPLPDMTVTLVAEMIGFADVNYFAKVFSKENGISPGEYRKRHRASVHVDEDIEAKIREIYL